MLLRTDLKQATMFKLQIALDQAVLQPGTKVKLDFECWPNTFSQT